MENSDVSSPNMQSETTDVNPHRPGPSGLQTSRMDIVNEPPPPPPATRQINQLTPQYRSFEDILLDTIRQTPIVKK